VSEGDGDHLVEALPIPWGFVSASRFCREGQKHSGFLLGSFCSCNSHEAWQSGWFITAHNQSSKKNSYWNTILHFHLGKVGAMAPLGLLQQVLCICGWKVLSKVHEVSWFKICAAM